MKKVIHITFEQAYYADETGKKPVHAVVHNYEPDDYLGDKEIYAGQMEIEVNFPEPSPSDFVLAEVAALRKKQGKLVAEGTKLEERIQSLLCIEAPKSEVL